MKNTVDRNGKCLLGCDLVRWGNDGRSLFLLSLGNIIINNIKRIEGARDFQRARIKITMVKGRKEGGRDEGREGGRKDYINELY